MVEVPDEIARHRPYRGTATGADGHATYHRRCKQCLETWPCLVSRMADERARLRAENARLREESRKRYDQALIATEVLLAITERRDHGAEGAHCATLAEDGFVRMSKVK